MKEEDYFTVEFKITDKKKFKRFMQQITKSFAEELDFRGAEIVACGQGTAMTESDYLSAYLLEQGEDPDEIIADAKKKEANFYRAEI